ncbi:MAG: dienelactone hydrolase family protein [Verrucomicrobiae bacterium]|nr:dienelactone hydrolase family protein [Verrucomicrobiae bacterium]
MKLGRFVRGMLWSMALAGACLVGLAWWAWREGAPAPYRPDQPREPVVREREKRGPALVARMEFTGPGGERIPCLVCTPSKGEGRLPAVIFLYGIGMNCRDIEPVAPLFAEAGFALFCPEQLMRGDRKEPNISPVVQALRFNRRVRQTGAELRALADALEEVPDVDVSRIYFWGASFGAITTARDVAEDPRFRAAIFTLAGGDLGRFVAEGPTRDRASVPQRWALSAAARYFAAMDPVRFVGGIAPRPMLFQNTEGDDILPRACAEALHNAAGEPKEIRWYPFAHNHLGHAQVEHLVRDGIEWLKKVDGAAAP